MRHRTHPHLPSKVAGTSPSSRPPPQPLHCLPLNLPPVLENPPSSLASVQAPQQPATAEGREKLTGRGARPASQVQSPPSRRSHRYPCLSHPWPETGRQGFLGGRGSWWAGYSDVHCDVVPTPAMWTDPSLRSAGHSRRCTCRVRDGLKGATRRLRNHRLAFVHRVTRYLSLKYALCA